MVTISAQFNGPDRSGNGGYVSGLLAAQVGTGGGAGPRAADGTGGGAGPRAAGGTSGARTSTLRQPPPLGVPLTWERHGEEVRLVTAGGALVGSSEPGAFVAGPLDPPTATEAEAGLAAYPGFRHHPFDHCFTCGTAREEGDGLRLFTGPVGDGVRTAGPWTPHAAFAGDDGMLDEPTTWAALDCPGGWAADFTVQPMVLGRMTAEVLRRPAAGEPLLASGALVERDGRKFRTSTALHTTDGELLGRAEQVWIEIDLDRFS